LDFNTPPGRRQLHVNNIMGSGPSTPVLRQDPTTPPSFASGFVNNTRRKLCNSDMNKIRRERYAERKLMVSAVASGNDNLLAKALITKVGKKAMPMCANLFGGQAHWKKLADNSIALMKEVGHRHKHEVAHLLTKGLPKGFAADKLQMSTQQLKRAYAALDLNDGRALRDACYANAVTRNKVTEGMDLLFHRFFHRTTHQCSGANNSKARIMDTEYHLWEALLHSNWPALLRELAGERPDLVPDLADMPNTGWTDFDACMLSAVHQTIPDTEAEQALRHKEFIADYCDRMSRVRGELPAKSKAELDADQNQRRARTASRLQQETFKPAEYFIEAPRLKTFRTWLIKKGLRYTRFTVPHPCPLCNQGPTDEVVFAALKKQMDDLAIAQKPIPAELTKRCSKLRASLRIYRVHRAQLATARAEAKEAEDNLAPGTCMVIRDFVNHHDHAGAHVKCLHWVLMWRDKVGEPIKRLKLRHYCSDAKTCSTDSFYQADVTDFHLNEDNPHCPKLFEPFHTIIFVGDHGPHFASHQTMHNESTLSRRYGKTIKLMFLASYHAYSRADGSGAEDSTGLRRDLRCGYVREGSEAMKDMTNESNDPASWAYGFPSINRNLNIFPPEHHFKAKDRAKWIKKWCQVEFDHPDKSADYDGILQYRLVTGQGDWQWTDLIAASRTPEQTMCDRCSTKEQLIVYHQQSDCPKPAYIHNLPTYVDLQPDPNRIQGEQVSSKKKNGSQKEKPTYACKFSNCAHHKNKRRAFRSATTANRHMQLEHKPTDAEWHELAYPDGDGDNVAARRPANRGPTKQKKKPRKASVRPHDASDDDSAESPHPTSDSQELDNQPTESSASEGEDAVEDPEEEIDIEEGVYVVANVLAHKLMANGTTKYRVAWEDSPVITWEPEKSINASLRSDYHLKQSQTKAAAEANRLKARQGTRKRQKRSKPTGEEMAKRLHWVETQTAVYVKEKKMSYYDAYEAAGLEYDSRD
jgi:hypothetical protein